MSFSLFFRDFSIRASFAIFGKMKMFLLFLSAIVLGVTFSEGRVRRQIWPAPGNPNFFWNRPGNDFYDDGDFWPGPPRFDRPFRRQNGFRDDFDNGNDLDQNDFRDDFRDDFSNGNNQNQNQNRRTTTTTTESSDPFATTPRTIHVAPQGCTCPMTQQFNPVCGTDGNTYRNMGLMNCYKRCGTNVSQKRLGVC